MKFSQTCMLAAVLATGLVAASPMFAEPETAVVVEAEAQVQSTTVSGQIQLPASAGAGADSNGLAYADVLVRIVGKLDPMGYPTPDNWTEMSREEQVAWRDAFKETEEYRELRRLSLEAQAARIVMTTGVNEDGTFSFDGLTPNSYKLQALIKRPDAGEEFSSHVSVAYKEMIFNVPEAEEAIDLGEITLRLQRILAPGDFAPEWTAVSYEGVEVSLSDFRGKFVLVDFWATWCGPCKAEVPNLEAVYADFGGEQFEIIGLSLDATLDLPKNYHANKPSPYTNLYLGKWNEETTTGDYGIRGIPSIWLIGPDGRIVARDLRGEALREAVQAAMEGAAGDEALAETETETE